MRLVSFQEEPVWEMCKYFLWRLILNKVVEIDMTCDIRPTSNCRNSLYRECWYLTALKTFPESISRVQFHLSTLVFQIISACLSINKKGTGLLNKLTCSMKSYKMLTMHKKQLTQASLWRTPFMIT